MLAEQTAQRGEPGFGRRVAKGARGNFSVEHLNDGSKRRRLGQRRAHAFENSRGFVDRDVSKMMNDARLADPRLAANDDHAAGTFADLLPDRGELRGLLFATDVRRETTASCRFELGACTRRPDDLEQIDGLREASEALWAKSLELEVTRNELCHRARDDDSIGRGDRSNASRDVDRLPHREPIARPGGRDLAHHRHPRMEAGSHMNFRVQPLPDPIVHELDALLDSQRGADGADRVVFVGDRIAKVRQHAVAEQLRDVTLVVADAVHAYALVAGEQVAKLFDVEAL